MFLLSSAYMISVGSVATVRPAPTTPHLVDYVPTMSFTPTVTVYSLSVDIHTSASMYSFQELRNVSIATVDSIGASIGSMIT